jgi:Zn-dependent peptidase ImmA (M78 family)
LVDGDLAVAVVSRQRDPGRRRTTAAHELGHLVLGDEYSSDLSVSASRAERESVIDAFAAELLLPTEIVSRQLVGPEVRAGLTKLAATYRTSWTLAVRQASRAGVVTASEAAKLRSATPTLAEFRDAIGWGPQPDLDSVRVPPSYAHAVIQAWQQDYVTSARAVELMYGQIAVDDLPLKPEPEL